ncbi:hypothetical protein E18064_150078 [Elizabethkingia anophelis]|nr:hypothetical protein E18064_150078 [Elizabethkingia anophelis]
MSTNTIANALRWSNPFNLSDDVFIVFRQSFENNRQDFVGTDRRH